MIKDCCKDEKNLVQETPNYKRCQKCGCRHFEFDAEPLGKLIPKGQ